MVAPWRFLPCETCCETLTCDWLCNWADAGAITLDAGAIVDGDVTSLYSHSAGYLEVRPAAGGLDLSVSYQLGTAYSPISGRAAGRYQAAVGKSLDVYLRDFVAGAWDPVGTWEHATVDVVPNPTYALSADHVSAGGEVRLRFRTADTDAAYRLYLDVTRACHDRQDFDQYEVEFPACPGCPGLAGAHIADQVEGSIWRYEFDPPLVCGANEIGSVEFQMLTGNWLEPYNIHGMIGWCRVRLPDALGGGVLSQWYGYIYPPADCDLNALTLPYVWYDTLGCGANRPIVSAVH